MENWRDIETWEGFYQVSDHGRVRSLTRTILARNPWGEIATRTYQGRELVAAPTPKGYLHVALSAPCRREERYVHMLVAEAFLGPAPAGKEVCHDNGRPAENDLGNLRYDTRAGNAMDRHKHGTMNQPKGEACPSAKLTEVDVLEARALRGVESQRSLGARFGVAHTTIGNAQRRVQWRHVA